MEVNSMQLLKLTIVMATFSLCRIYHQAMTKNRLRLSLLEARWPAEQASRNVWRFAPFVRQCISSSMATIVCTHGTAILTNHGPQVLNFKILLIVIVTNTVI